MGEPSATIPQPEKTADDRLDSWKEIAAYLNRDVTTAQRWEKREGMPVHRHLHDRAGSVYAFRSELDEWTRGRNPADSGDNRTRVVSEPQRLSALSHWKAALSTMAVAALIVTGASMWVDKSDYFWRNPIAGARFQSVTESEGTAEGAALSRDGQILAFLSDRDGPTDVWITQAGSGQFHNLTHGEAGEIVNPSIRPLAFSPDGALVTFWVRKQDQTGKKSIGIWAVPTLGGEPRPYLEGAAEMDWSRDGSRIAYHTTDAGDPLFISDGDKRAAGRPIFTAPSGLHAHFPVWAPDSAFIYFVHGALPDKLNIFRIAPSGGDAQQLTFQPRSISYPVFLNPRTLVYLATDANGTGPFLYGMDVEHRKPHKLSFGPERYTSLAASADGRRLAVTVASSKTTLWRIRIADSPAQAAPTPVVLTTGTGRSPRLGPDYLVYVSSTGAGQSIWKLADGTEAELWGGAGTQVLGAPAVSPDGRQIAFSASQEERKFLYEMQSDGSNVRALTESLDLQGGPAWSPDGKTIAVAANEHGTPHLFRVPEAGGPPVRMVQDYSMGPTWSPDGRFVLYSGADIGTTFSVKAAGADGADFSLRPLTLTRGARHVAFVDGGRALVILRGEIRHKNLWRIELQTGEERQLTNLQPDFDVRDFDISPDGRAALLERSEERSDVVLLDLPR